MPRRYHVELRAKWNRVLEGLFSRRETILWTGALLSSLALVALMAHGSLDVLAAVLIGAAALIAVFVDRALAACLCLSYLALMGDIRRIVSFESHPSSFDFLLLIGPLIGTVLGLPVLVRIRLRDTVSGGMFVLLLIMILEVFNPREGSLAVGLSGMLFYVAPVLWFWAGRSLGSPAVVLRLVYRVLIPLGILAAALGLVQTFLGFLPWEQDWISRTISINNSLYVGKAVRAFGFSISSAEYSFLLLIATVAICSRCFVRRWIGALALAILIPAIILESSRGLIVRLVIALVCAWGLRKNKTLRPAELAAIALSAAITLIGIVSLASHLAPERTSDAPVSTIQDEVTHQTDGLAHPFDSKYSTASIHGGMILSGIQDGIARPVGYGLGATTLAAKKFEGKPVLESSEVDVSDMFIDTGLLGGITYIIVIVGICRQALRYLRNSPLYIGLPVVTILMATLGSWLIGGQYSTASIVLFLIGSLGYSPARDRSLAASEFTRAKRDESQSVTAATTISFTTAKPGSFLLD